MVHHFEGQLVLLGPARAVIETGGIGFELRIPLSTFQGLKGREGTRVRLLAHLQVLTDDLRLYGFATEAERELFRLVTSIGGVGPAIGLHLLATFDPAAFARAILSGDSRALRRIKGVGTKLSERIVLELKDRAQDLAQLAGAGAAPPGVDASTASVPETVVADVARALVELGFSRREADQRVKAAIELLVSQAGGADPRDCKPRPGGPPSEEAILQAALRGQG